MASNKRLTLLRHGRAMPATTLLTDWTRPLDDRGEQDAKRVARRIEEFGIRPSLVLTSPADRALQTARLVATTIGYPLEFLQQEPQLYLASPGDVLAILANQDSAFNDVLVCGHNPGLTDLARRLTGAHLDPMPTCGFVVIEAPIRDWSDLQSNADLTSRDSAAGPFIVT